MRGGTGNEHARMFADVFNDVQNYPTLRDVAKALGRSDKTIENYATIMRKRSLENSDAPVLISRRKIAKIVASEAAPEVIQKTPDEHAQFRADDLFGKMVGLFVKSRFPVTNPEAMTIRPSKRISYDRHSGENITVHGTPKTWLSDTLRVEGIENPKNRTFLFTGAQNDSPVHQGFWFNLRAYAAEIGAEVVIGPWTYETNWWDESNPAARSYDPLILDHLCFGQMKIGEEFIFCGEMNTLPTATKPISDLTIYSRGKWAVYPHASVQLCSVPSVDPSEQAFQIMTTGAVTLPQVIPRKAGIKSIANHVIGATIVEFDDEGDFFCRQIIATENGAFQDLDAKVSDETVTWNNSVRALTVADIHVAKLGRKNALATLGYDYKSGDQRSGSILDVLRPQEIVLHDIHDHESRSHHEKDNVSHNYEMAVRGRESVEIEIGRAVNLVVGLAPFVKRIVVVESNHDQALERYIREGRYRGDGINLMFGLKLDLALNQSVERRAICLEAEQKPAAFSLLEWAMREQAGVAMNHVVWAYENTSYMIDGVQAAFHGHRGTNGAKGSVAGYARMGRDITIGDKHSPSILNGVYGAGVMEMQHGYNKGPSGWCVSHVVQYDNGKRTIITLRGGKWRVTNRKSTLT